MTEHDRAVPRRGTFPRQSSASKGVTTLGHQARARVWTAWIVVLMLALASLVTRLLSAPVLFDQLDGPHWWAELLWWNILVPLGVVAFATAGALIVNRDSSSRLGWLAMLLAALTALHDLTWQYAVRSFLLEGGLIRLTRLAGWFAFAVGPAMLVLTFALVLLHFPDGQLVRRSWWTVRWASVALALLNLAGSAFISIESVEDPRVRPSALTVDLSIGPAGWIHGLVEFGVAIVLLLAVASIFIRWHRARSIQRLQLKWIGYVGAIIGVAMTGWFVAVSLTGDSYISLAMLTVNVGMVTIGVPAAVGIAILRYRLFDIDLMINRTLVYASLTLILGTGYAVVVLILQEVFGRFLGGDDIAVVLATLLAVAAVRPLRGRIQRLVDRRFFRPRYDSATTLARFGRKVHEEVDLDRLQEALIGVVGDTLGPRAVSLYLVDVQAGDATRADRVDTAS